MKFLPVYKEKLGCNSPDEVFDYLISTLKETVTGWDFFVNWPKVNNMTRKVEIDLNLMNYLIGKDDIEKEALQLIKEHPQIARTIPALLACRKEQFHILKEYQNGKFVYETPDFSKKGNISPETAVAALKESGFLDQLQKRRIKSLVDYVFGVEAGLDSNGRKNRGGTAMEEVVEFFVADICKRKGYPYIVQATAEKVKKEWGRHITVDKSSRRIDFAINTPEKMFLIETNFYSGGGSKLKSTAGEYKTDFQRWKADGNEFIWVTDGAGWRTTQKPLQETFNETNHIINLSMLESCVLESILR
jgi:type II restriction enzyme